MAYSIKMLNLSLNELKLVTKSRGIKGYKRMSEDKVLSALNPWESVKMPDRANTKKTIREIKENRNEDKVFRDF